MQHTEWWSGRRTGPELVLYHSLRRGGGGRGGGGGGGAPPPPPPRGTLLSEEQCRRASWQAQVPAWCSHAQGQQQQQHMREPSSSRVVAAEGGHSSSRVGEAGAPRRARTGAAAPCSELVRAGAAAPPPAGAVAAAATTTAAAKKGKRARDRLPTLTTTSNPGAIPAIPLRSRTGTVPLETGSHRDRTGIAIFQTWDRCQRDHPGQRDCSGMVPRVGCVPLSVLQGPGYTS
jgi:hypothetical protein